jgi:hypothetical protein
MGDARGGPRLAQEPCLRRGAAVTRAQQLERHAAIELGIVGRVDDTHSSRAEPVDDDVTPYSRADGRRELFRSVVVSLRAIVARELDEECAAVGTRLEVSLDEGPVLSR